MQPHVIKIEMNAVLDATLGDMLDYRQLEKAPCREISMKDLANNLGRLTQVLGNKMTKVMNTIVLIHPKQILTTEIILWVL